jgi:hypothetical protein
MLSHSCRAIDCVKNPPVNPMPYRVKEYCEVPEPCHGCCHLKISTMIVTVQR